MDSQIAVATDARDRELIEALQLHVLPKESGYLGVIGVLAQKTNIDEAGVRGAEPELHADAGVAD